MRKLSQHHIGRLLNQPRPALERSLAQLRLSEILNKEGRARVSSLLMDLLRRSIRTGTEGPSALSQELLEGCPSFFPHQHEVYLRAFQALQGSSAKSGCALLTILSNVGSFVFGLAVPLAHT